jgi:hypothetical protein
MSNKFVIDIVTNFPIYLTVGILHLRINILYFSFELANPLQQSHWEPGSGSAGQEIPRLLWYPKVHDRVQNRQRSDPILIHLNPVQTLRSYSFFFRISLNTTEILNTILPYTSSIFPLGFRAKFVYLSMRTTWDGHLNIWWRVEMKKLLAMHMSLSSC